MTTFHGLQAHTTELSRIGALAREQHALNVFEAAERMRTYRMKLSEADWHGAMAEGDAYRSFTKDFAFMYSEQAEIDADGSVWNSYKPAGFMVPNPRVEISMQEAEECSAKLWGTRAGA